jgi:hypothetical protein
MPRIGFKTENKTASGAPQFPKLKLKVGEKARIIIGLEDAHMEYVHTLRKPIMENGKPKMERDQKGNLKMEKAFVSRPLCTGDQDVLEKKSLDPENCQMCALAKEDSEMGEAPEMRFAVNVFQYRTKSGSHEVQVPFSGEVVVWAFPASKFNKIIDIADEFGDLKNHDIVLGPCENEMWQKFDINGSPKAVWRETDDNTKFVVESFKENKFADLALACGQRKEQRWLDKDIQDIRDAWAEVRRAGSSSPANEAGLDDDLNSLIDSSGAQNRWAEPEEAAEAVATPAPAPAAKPKSTEPVSIESLLGEVEDDGPAAVLADDSDDDGMSEDAFASMLADLNKD